jgi:hypothetical protein
MDPARPVDLCVCVGSAQEPRKPAEIPEDFPRVIVPGQEQTMQSLRQFVLHVPFVDGHVESVRTNKLEARYWKDNAELELYRRCWSNDHEPN